MDTPLSHVGWVESSTLELGLGPSLCTCKETPCVESVSGGMNPQALGLDGKRLKEQPATCQAGKGQARAPAHLPLAPLSQAPPPCSPARRHRLAPHLQTQLGEEPTDLNCLHSGQETLPQDEVCDKTCSNLS